MGMEIQKNDFKNPLRVNCFDVKFESDSVLDDVLNKLRLSVSSIIFPDIDIHSIYNVTRYNFELTFADILNIDTVYYVKMLSYVEDLFIVVRIYSDDGKQVYKDITLSDVIVNYFNIGLLDHNNDNIRKISMKFNARCNIDDFVKIYTGEKE